MSHCVTSVYLTDAAWQMDWSLEKTSGNRQLPIFHFSVMSALISFTDLILVQASLTNDTSTEVHQKGKCSNSCLEPKFKSGINFQKSDGPLPLANILSSIKACDGALQHTLEEFWRQLICYALSAP